MGGEVTEDYLEHVVKDEKMTPEQKLAAIREMMRQATAHIPAEPKEKKPEPETFEARAAQSVIFDMPDASDAHKRIAIRKSWAVDLCREADQQIADLEHKNALQITLIAQYMQDRDEKERERDQARAAQRRRYH